jgi:hypothetical protein
MELTVRARPAPETTAGKTSQEQVFGTDEDRWLAVPELIAAKPFECGGG